MTWGLESRCRRGARHRNPEKSMVHLVLWLKEVQLSSVDVHVTEVGNIFLPNYLLNYSLTENAWKGM